MSANVTAGTRPLHIRGFKEAILTQSTIERDFGATIARRMTTDQIQEEFIWFSGVATAQKRREGGRVFYDIVSAPKRKTFITEEWSIGVEFTKKALRTDQSGMLKRASKAMGLSHYNSHQRMIADIINNGTSSSYLGIDGVALFSASHITGTGTFSNLSTQAATSPDSIKQMLVDLGLHLTYKDEPWIRSGGGYNAVYHINQELEMAEILESVLKAQELSNTKNVIGMSPSGSIKWNEGNPFLTDTNAITLIPAGEKNPIFFLVGEEMDVIEIPTSDFTIKYGSNRDETVGWIGAWGVQHNIGA